METGENKEQKHTWNMWTTGNNITTVDLKAGRIQGMEEKSEKGVKAPTEKAVEVDEVYGISYRYMETP